MLILLAVAVGLVLWYRAASVKPKQPTPRGPVTGQRPMLMLPPAVTDEMARKLLWHSIAHLAAQCGGSTQRGIDRSFQTFLVAAKINESTSSADQEAGSIL